MVGVTRPHGVKSARRAQPGTQEGSKGSLARSLARLRCLLFCRDETDLAAGLRAHGEALHGIALAVLGPGEDDAADTKR